MGKKNNFKYFKCQKILKKMLKIIDRFLKKYFKKQKYSDLMLPMKYGTLFGGKKLDLQLF